MEERNGIISEEQLKNYEGADIILMQNSNEGTDSGFGGNLSGTGSYNWFIRWDSNGFSGVNWEAFSGENQLDVYGSLESLETAIESDPVEFAISVATTNGPARRAGCAGAERIS